MFLFSPLPLSLQMRFESVQTIFYQYIPRRYHRFCRELFNQLLCLYLMVKPAYLFDLFPLSIKDMRLLLASLSAQLPFSSLLLKYSMNDLIIINRAQITQLLDSTVLIIDLTAMTTSESHPMIDQVPDMVDTDQNFLRLCSSRCGIT